MRKETRNQGQKDQDPQDYKDPQGGRGKGEEKGEDGKSSPSRQNRCCHHHVRRLNQQTNR